MQTRLGKMAMLFGGLTLILFASRPYILDLIAPAKSIGQLIGENAKDLIESLNSETVLETKNSKREIWSNILLILSFISFASAIFFSMSSLQKAGKNWFGIGGGVLAIAGIGIYFSYLAIGFIGLIFVGIAAIVVVLALFGG